MRERQAKSRTKYTSEYREMAVAMVRRGDRTYRQLGEELGVNPFTLRNWWKADDMARRGKKKSEVQASIVVSEAPEQRIARLERELKRLERENESLRMDREILKKAAAFFAKESE